MTHTPEELRLQLLANGYSPLPNIDKRCVFKGWPTTVLTVEEIKSWTRKRLFAATGLRIEKLLAAIDIDVNGNLELTNELRDAVDSVVPGLSSRACIRLGKGFKEAWFVRCDEVFSRIHSRRWVAPGAVLDDGTHSVEIFGGGSPRQFGAFGAHTRRDDGTVEISYSWDGPSPLDIRQSELPVITKAQAFAIVDAIEAVLIKHGYTPVLRSQAGESDAHRVYDLTNAMRFDMADGRTLSLSELSAAASAEDGLRCSASWLEGPTASNTSRCLVSLTRAGNVAIWESAAGITHCEADKAPADRTIDIDRFQEKLRELASREENRLNPRDSAMVSAEKLLYTYAYHPTARNCVVPLWSKGFDEAMTLTAFRILMLPFAETEIGPRGGEKKINPVDIWASQHDRINVAGLRLRPDQPRPTYSEGGAEWVNIYSPPDHPTAGGTAEPFWRFLERLVPDERERKWFICWLACKFRCPWITGVAVVMVAHQTYGTGRGLLGQVISRLFGRHYVKDIDFATFTGATYQSQYNDWAASSLVVVVNESAETEGSEYKAKRNAYEHLKNIIDPAPHERLVNVKGEGNFIARMFASYFIATNHANALQIPAIDRRFSVLSNGEKQTEAEVDEIVAWMADPANIGALARDLEQVDLTGYNPVVPLQTDAKAEMADAALSDLDRAFAEAVRGMKADVFVRSQVQHAIEKLEAASDLDLPQHWKPTIKRELQKHCYRVGVRNGINWHPVVQGTRAAVYARSKEHAKAWTHVHTDMLIEEVLKNGDPDATPLSGLSNVIAMRRK